jgi:hypothetical protein
VTPHSSAISATASVLEVAAGSTIESMMSDSRGLEALLPEAVWRKHREEPSGSRGIHQLFHDAPPIDAGAGSGLCDPDQANGKRCR